MGARLGVAALLVASWVAGAAIAAPAPSTVVCGQTITRDTVLANDLVNCPDDGLVIGANGVALDLNGHLIDGDGEDFDGEFAAGVDNTGGFDRVRISNGRVRQFEVGVQIGSPAIIAVGTEANRVHGLSLSGGFPAIELNGTTASRVEGNTVRDTGVGVQLNISHGNRVEGNRITEATGTGITIGVADNNTIAANLIRVTGSSSIDVQSGRGNQIVRNTMGGGPPDDGGLGGGINISQAVGTVVSQNTLGGGASLSVSGIRDGVTRNTVIERNALDRHTGITLIGAVHDTRLERNSLTGQVTVPGRLPGPGISLVGQDPEFGGGEPRRTLIARNVVRAGPEDGIALASGATASVIERNEVIGNGDDGIEVRTSGNTVTANVANRNGDLGIRAVAGNRDGGGNTAQGNGDPRQCVGVVCR